jgi:hypothetical protein
MKKMRMNRDFIFRVTICLALLFVTGCAEIRLNSLPAPSPTAKLRVFVLPVSGALSWGAWPMPHAAFANRSYQAIGRMLSDKGIYAVVSQEEVRKVTDGQETIGWQWEKNEWELIKKTGRALHADYALILMRGHSGFFYVKMVMINLATGRQYEKNDPVQNTRDQSMQAREYARVFHECYQEIFRQAKGDMLATAIRKGRLTPQASELPVQEVVRIDLEEKPAVPVGVKPEQPEAVAADPVPQKPALPAGEIARNVPGEKPAGPAGGKLEQPKPAAVDKVPQRMAGVGASGDRPAIRSAEPGVKQTAKSREDQKIPAKERMIVYDLQTTAQLNVVALILSEALREELFALGGFDLINREDMGQAIQEMKLQQSGLIDDKQAVQIGKWMAANQTITGNLGIIGDALILQTKRTDLQTMVILSRGSARAGVGKEEELLNALPALAQKLIAR